MANTFVSLPPPGSGIGPGDPVDVSALGAAKTITQSGGGGVLIEYSNDPAALQWTTLLGFQKAGVQQAAVACSYLRQNVTTVGASSSTVAVGGAAGTVTVQELTPPANNGTGAEEDTSALPGFKSIQVTGSFKGIVNIEISVNGGSTFSTVASFGPGGGNSSGLFYCDRMRVVRSGISPAAVAGTPIIRVGATDAPGSGGGGITGTLSNGVIPYATAPTVLGDSIAIYDGTKIAITRAFTPSAFDALLEVGGGGGLSVYSPDEGATVVAFCRAFRFGAMLGGSTVYDLGVNAGGTFNDLNVQGSVGYAVTPGGGVTLTGLEQVAGFENLAAPFVFLMNVGTGSLTLNREDAGSTSTNRFFLTAATLVIPAGGGVLLFRGIQIPSLANEVRWIAVGVNK